MSDRGYADHDQPGAVLHHRMTQIAQPRLAASALAMQLGVRIGLGGAHFIATLFATEVLPLSARASVVAENFSAEPTLRSAGVHREVLIPRP